MAINGLSSSFAAQIPAVTRQFQNIQRTEQSSKVENAHAFSSRSDEERSRVKSSDSEGEGERSNATSGTSREGVGAALNVSA